MVFKIGIVKSEGFNLKILNASKMVDVKRNFKHAQKGKT